MKRILVADDEEQIRSVLRQMLEHEGYVVDTVENGEAGMAMMAKNHYDLIITDMIMPVKDGLKFIMELMRDYPKANIVAISGGGAIKADRYLTMASYLGDIATLEKPFKRNGLIKLVRQRLGEAR